MVNDHSGPTSAQLLWSVNLYTVNRSGFRLQGFITFLLIRVKYTIIKAVMCKYDAVHLKGGYWKESSNSTFMLLKGVFFLNIMVPLHFLKTFLNNCVHTYHVIVVSYKILWLIFKKSLIIPLSIMYHQIHHL